MAKPAPTVLLITYYFSPRIKTTDNAPAQTPNLTRTRPVSKVAMPFSTPPDSSCTQGKAIASSLYPPPPSQIQTR
ncbi:MAG: hypothetical protein ACLFWI_27960 [Coleofasciculus sp.]|uniref:hypothetical protein n=1 Tax=Coleofasciculus sp. TaxID=3100458 RepID=UPI003A4ACD1F